MKRSGKYFFITAVLMVFLVFALPILAQQGEMMAGRMAGEMAARSSVNGTAWLAIGCLGNAIGVIIAYVVEPNPPATQLLGKSPEYVAAYSDAYRMTAKRIQTFKAWTGCLIFSVVYVGLSVLYAAALSESTY